MAKRDLTGMRFGRLVALCDDGTRDKHKNVMWKCQCDCGNIAYVRTSFLTRKNRPTLSCGCLQKEAIKNKWKDEEFKQKHSDKMREVSKQLWQDEEFRRMHSDRMREAWEDVAYTGDTTLYVEMQKTVDEMNNGVSEIDALYNFGSRCIIPEI